jgi:non-specific serine/threonine protein kinase
MPAAAHPACYRFARFELHPAERRLLAAGAPVDVGSHAFDLLVALVESGGQLVTKAELLERVWPKRVVEEQNLHVQVWALRKILGSETIETIPGHGFRFTPDLTCVGAASATSTAAPKHNLPQQLTSFIGREKDVAEIKTRLTTQPLVTLTGAGGCGKTRLAIQVASELADACPDGVWLVELASVAEPGLVPQTVAAVLGLKEEAGKSLTQSVTAHLASRHLLLVLDNAEHLLAACAELGDAVLRRCAQVVILITSRERLAIAGEQVYRVPGMSTPDTEQDATVANLVQYESVRLFIERARLNVPHFVVTNENAPALASVCRRLDGIPLAIELAAARVRSMSVEELNERLDQCFRVLTGGSRMAPRRQQTLRALIDWSYDLLTAAEKVMLRRVSVFSGGWTLEAAEQVCVGEGIDRWEVLDLLSSLADKNLMLLEERGAATRYRLLETVRQYAQERLQETGERERWHAGHLAYFVALAEEAEPLLVGAHQRAWLDRLETENNNLRSAMVWSAAIDDREVAGLRLASALSRFWYIRGYQSEGRGWLTRLLATAPRARAAAARAKALNVVGGLALEQADYPAARALCDEGLALYQELGDRRGIANALSNLGALAAHQGDYPAGRALLEESLAIRRQLDDRWGISTSLSILGDAALDQSDYRAARALHEESLAIKRELGNRYGMAIELHYLGTVAKEEGDHRSARARFEESLAIRRELGDRHGIAESLEGLASGVSAMGMPDRAARIWGRAERLREEIGSPIKAGGQRRRYDRDVAAARADLGDDAAFDSAWHEGRATTLDRAIAVAVEMQDA